MISFNFQCCGILLQITLTKNRNKFTAFIGKMEIFTFTTTNRLILIDI
jgi:hypothetical protein